MVKISAVIITKNESENIARCITALQGVVNEVLVVDAMSEDDTLQIAKENGAKVIQNNWLGYAQMKNFANSKASHDWILSIDADEVLSEELRTSLKNLEPHRGIIYSLDRLNNFCGQWIKYCDWYPDWKKRLFHRLDIRWKGNYVHEDLDYPQNTKIIKLKGKLFHYSYTSLEDHQQRIQKYAQLSAEKMQAAGKRTNWIKETFGPGFRFFKTYILKRGFLDGKNGWIISQQDAALVRKKYQFLKKLNAQDHSI